MVRYICVFLILVADAFAWHYTDQEHWSSMCLSGKKQSPIALSPRVADEIFYTPLILDNYETNVQAIIKNNGHSAEVRFDIPLEDRPEIKGGNLPSIYILDHLHFHWHSEHTINDHRYPLELHMVHYNKKFPNISEALKVHNGVAVFAVMFHTSPDDFTTIDSLVHIVDLVKSHHNTHQLPNFNINRFLPIDTAGYYRYEGSLTTPDCNEGILWTVFTNSLPISEKQVNIFESLEVAQKRLGDNNRRLQDLNDRKVYLKVSPVYSGTTAISGFNAFLLSLFVVFAFVH